MINKMQYLNGETWVLTLNKYHRDNLLLLLNFIMGISEPNGFRHPPVEPFSFFNNGDWVGELMWMLGKPIGHYGEMETSAILTNDQPKVGRKELLDRLESWKKYLINQGGPNDSRYRIFRYMLGFLGLYTSYLSQKVTRP